MNRYLKLPVEHSAFSLCDLFNSRKTMHKYASKFRVRSIDLAVCAPDEPCFVDRFQRQGKRPRMSQGNNADLFTFLVHGIPWNMELERMMTKEEWLLTQTIAITIIPGTDSDVQIFY